MSSRPQRATLLKLPQYEAALRGLWAKSPAPQMEIVDEHAAMEYIKEAVETGRLLEVGDYLLLYSISPLWFSGDKELLIEELVIRFQRVNGNPVSDVAEVLKSMCQDLNLYGVCSGDTQIGAMCGAYENAGFMCIGKQFYWSHSNGSSP